MALPIFIIGKNRSGTKWLSNIIANHREVACIQHEDHFGILESQQIFTTMPMVFGSLSVDENFIAFLECFGQTDFFRLTGLNKDIFYVKRQADYFTFFRFMMNLYADKQGKKRWVQKANTFGLKKLYRHFPDGKFIMIVRNVRENIRSTIALEMGRQQGKDYKKKIIRELFKYFLEKKRIDRFRRNDNVMVVRFKDLKCNRQAIIERICTFLDIDFDENMLVDKFAKNTSFRNGISREDMFTKVDLFIMKMLTPILHFVPWQLYESLYALKTRVFGYAFISPKNRTPFFLSFKLRKKEIG